MRSLLTLPGSFGNSGLPQTKQGVTDAFPVPHTMEKNGLFCFVSNIATGLSLWAVLHIDGARPDDRETRAALLWPGSVFRLFLCLNP